MQVNVNLKLNWVIIFCTLGTNGLSGRKNRSKPERTDIVVDSGQLVSFRSLQDGNLVVGLPAEGGHTKGVTIKHLGLLGELNFRHIREDLLHQIVGLLITEVALAAAPCWHCRALATSQDRK